jgi:hypothetical protein
VVDEDEDGFVLTCSAADFYAFRDAGKDGVNPGFFEEAGGEVVEEGRVEPRADVGDAAFADFARDYGGLVVEPTITFSVALDDFGVG